MATIYRPCYATREEVRRALDVKQSAYNSTQVDRAIQSGADSVDGLCMRKFYPEDRTHFFDWPNYQYAYPWRVWLDASEMADVTTNVPVVTSGGILIDPTTIFWGDPNYPEAPFTYLELSRASNSSFGNGPTPQREISIKGTFGYWLKWGLNGALAASMGSSDLTMTVNDGFSPGVGDLVLLDAERLIVTDASYISTGITPLGGCTTAQASDNVLQVPSGLAFTVGEVILLDAEWMLVNAILGNNLVVKRAWDGSILKTHAAPVIWARRLLSVLRGQLGTVAASHSNGAPVNVFQWPALVKDLSLAEALVRVVAEPAAYAGQIGANTASSSTGIGTSSFQTRVREPAPGAGLPMLREQVSTKYGRKARSRVI